MLGAGLQFGKVKGEDRFYIPVKARKNQNKKQEVVKEDEEKSNTTKLLAKSNNLASANNNKKKKNNTNPKKTPVSSTIPGTKMSNLERFLESTTPSVPAQYFSKTTMRGFRTCDVEYQPYFTLGDLWESFKEWSAYGAGVPLVLDGNDGVVQYYVPYLSGIQLYGESAKPRLAGEESENYYCRDSSSDGSSDYETGKDIKFSRELCSRFSLINENPFGVCSLSTCDENSTLQGGFSSDDCETGNNRDQLLFEFFEQNTPYSREALADKIFDLSSKYPGLNTLRSCELLPISWISVAWYPIYRIPTGSTLKDLDACFLTYHSLCTPMEGNGNGQTPFVVYPNDANGIPMISLPVFGVASYKLKGSMWTQNGVSERQHANSLMQAAENWLKLLQAQAQLKGFKLECVGDVHGSDCTSSKSISEKEEYSEKTFLSDLQQTQLIAYPATLCGNLTQHHTAERGQQMQKKQILQANSIKLSLHLDLFPLDETPEEEDEDEE